MTEPIWLNADWPAPPRVRALTTTRVGGLSPPPYDSLNLGLNSGDDPQIVQQNRQRLAEALSLDHPTQWLHQVHGVAVARLDGSAPDLCADASTTDQANTVCAVLTADCLPVFFAARDGSEVAVAHAGWRGLAAGVLEETLNQLRAKPEEIVACLGPAIGPEAFEVGSEVREVFLSVHKDNVQAFKPHGVHKFLCDIFSLARMHLNRHGVSAVYGGGTCTWSDATRFYSYRRDGVTGRMASLIWIES